MLPATRILDGLFLGGARDAVNRAGCINQFDIKGVVSVIGGQGYERCVRERLLDNANNPAYQDIEFVHLDIDDHPGESLDMHFAKAIEFIHQARTSSNKKRPVLVHCYMGISRSPTIIVAYLMTITNLGWKECLRAVKMRRPIVSPNDGFLEQLAEYEGKLKAKYSSQEMEPYRSYPGREDDIKAVEKLILLDEQKESGNN